jgi:hypothetical protein
MPSVLPMVNVPPGTHTIGILEVTVKSVTLDAVPSTVITVILPVVAPVGTTAVMDVALSTV